MGKRAFNVIDVSLVTRQRRDTSTNYVMCGPVVSDIRRLFAHLFISLTIATALDQKKV